MKKFTKIDILSILCAIATYIMIGPFIANMSNEIFMGLTKNGLNILGLAGLLPLVAVFFLYRFFYRKQMKLLSSDKFKNFLEIQRRKMLDNSTFAFDTKENVEKKYYPDAESFAKRLIPGAVLIIVVEYFISRRSGFDFLSFDFTNIEILSFYLGLILVIISFYPKTMSKPTVPPNSL